MKRCIPVDNVRLKVVVKSKKIYAPKPKVCNTSDITLYRMTRPSFGKTGGEISDMTNVM